MVRTGQPLVYNVQGRYWTLCARRIEDDGTHHDLHDGTLECYKTSEAFRWYRLTRKGDYDGHTR